MPTPSDEEAAPSSVMPMLVLDITAPMRGIFTSCPPEEGRSEQHIATSEEQEGHADQEAESARVDARNDQVTGGAQSGNADEERAEATLPAEVEGKIDGEDNTTSDQPAIQPEILAQSPSPAPSLPNSERDRDSDVRLAQSMATASISPSDATESQTPTARYLHFPENDRDRVRTYITCGETVRRLTTL